MKVLVTGGNGFVGKHVVAALQAAGHEAIVPTREEFDLIIKRGPGYMMSALHGKANDHVSFLCWFLLDRQIDAVIHLAAICGGIGVNKDNPGKFMYENLQMGVNIVEACRLANIKKLVNLSTVCSYPKHTPVPFKESDIWNGYPEETNAPYGIAKKAIVELGIAYHRQYGLNVTNLVPVNMAGEHDHFDLYSSHVLPALIKKFENPQTASMRVACTCPCHVDGNIRHVMACCDGQRMTRRAVPAVQLWGTGSASREFLYAGDCAKAIVKALETDTGPEPINLGTGQEITIKALAELVKKVGGYLEVEIAWDPSKPDGQPRRCLDTSRAKEVLGWEATTPIEETVRKTIEWYRANV
jgi:GDP-L-fucose synthase